MSSNDVSNNPVTGEQIPVTARAYWTQVAASHSLRRCGGALEFTPDGYECCNFCMRNVPFYSMINETVSPICVCCVIESALHPPEDKDDAKIWPPSYALQLLEESRFAVRLTRPQRRWSDVTEEDLEDPETGRIFGSRLVDRVTREEVRLEDCAEPTTCRGCNYMRILGWGVECDDCEYERQRGERIGVALASAAW